MKEKKRTMFRFSTYARGKMEAYLEKMARKGWLLEKVSGGMFHFRRMQPKNLRYCVFFSPEQTDSRCDAYGKVQELYEMCACAGWTAAASVGRLHIFYSENWDAVPVETSPRDELDSRFPKIEKRSKHSTAVAIFCLLSVISGVCQILRDPLTYLSDNDRLLYMGFCALLGIFLITDRVYTRIRKKQSWKRSGIGDPIPDPGLPGMIYLLYGGLLAAVLVVYYIYEGITVSSLRLAVMLGGFLLSWVGCLAAWTLLGGTQRSDKERITRAIVIKIAVFLVVCAVGNIGVTAYRETYVDGKGFRGSEPIAVSINGLYDVEYIYEDDLPLKVEDLTQVPEGIYSRWINHFQTERSVFMEKLLVENESPYGNYPSIKYTIITVPIDALYELVFQYYWDGYHYRNYQPMDADLWGAAAAYRSEEWGCLLCWDNRFAWVMVDHWEQELTAEQMAIIGQKLRDAAWPEG